MIMLSILILLPTIIIGLLIVSIFVYRLKTSRVTRLVNQLPGPKTTFLLGNAGPFVLANREEIFGISQALIKPYITDIGRFWIGAVSPQIYIFKAPAVEVVLRSAQDIEKSSQYRFFQCWLGTGLLTSAGNKWRSHRKMITPSFHFTILENFISVFNEQANVLVDILHKFEDKDPFDIYPYLTRCTLDIIVETAMGVQTITAQTNADSEYFKAVETITEIITARNLTPWMQLPDVLFNISPSGRVQAKCLRIVHEFSRKVIKERLAEYSAGKTSKVNCNDEGGIYGRKRRMAFLDLLLETNCDGRKLTYDEIREEVETFMFEGHDTTAVAATWILYNIGRLPEIQAKLHQELDDIFENSDRPVSSEDLHKMKFLECVIKESLRLFPSVPVFGRTLCEDTQVGEYLLPAGVDIMFPVYNIHRHPDNFPDPEKFDPDRFLPENAAGRHPYAYIPFSAGPRNCIGQKFAMMEEKIIVSQILRCFRIKSMQRLEELNFWPELVLRPCNGLWMKFHRRQEMAKSC